MLAGRPFLEDAEPMTDTSLRYTVTDLGVLPGFEASRATALNERGQVIGSLSHEEMDTDPSGFIWADGVLRDLGKVWLKDINNKGQCVGARHPKNTAFYATLYMAGRFQELLKNTSATSMACGINDSGQVIGFSQLTDWKSPASTKRGCFLWENGKRNYLGVPEGFRAGKAVAVNNKRQTAGEIWEGTSSHSHACLWDADAVKVFEEPSEFNQSEAISINILGQVLVRAFYSNFQELLEEASQGVEVTWADRTETIQKRADAIQEGLDAVLEKASVIPDAAWVHRQQYFLWQNDKTQAIDGLATALNDCGQVVGWTGCLSDVKGRKTPYALLWQNGELLDLNNFLPPDSGWRLTKASDINNEGQIVGHGEIAGKTRAFLLTPITS